MKTVLLILFTTMTATLIQATTYTCSNHPIGGAQFASFDDAFNASVDGDTILLEKSNISYNLISTMSKRLVIIGIGVNPVISDQNRCLMGGVGGDAGLSSNASGSQFHGITFVADLILYDTGDVTFENCSFEPGVFLGFYIGAGGSNSNLTNIKVINSVFEGIDEENIKCFTDVFDGGVQISNCIFNGYIENTGTVQTHFIIDHCVFLNNVLLGRFFKDLVGATITNCIFANQVLFPSTGNIDCTYLNNLASYTSPPVIPAVNGNVDIGNLYGPIEFSNYIIGETYSSDHDYDLNSTSIGVAAASDGTDIGVHGGFTNFNEALEPSMVPIVTDVLIQGGGAELGGAINVHVQARKPLPN